MKESILLVVTALISGLVATIITIWWQKISSKKQEKQKIFSVLMSKRYNITDVESVEALNLIDVVFYDSKSVREAWRKFKEATEAPETQNQNQIIGDKHLRLLEVIAENIGYRRIKWDDIKDYYNPVGLSQRMEEESVLRRVQIDAALSQIKDSEKASTNPQNMPNNQFVENVIMEAIRNPEGLSNLMEIATKLDNKGVKQ